MNVGPLHLIIVDWNMWLPASLVYKFCFSQRFGTSGPNCDLIFFQCRLHMTSPNSFHLHSELKIQGQIQAKKCEVFISISTFYWFFCCLKQKVIVLRTSTKLGCYFHPLLRVMGTSQSSLILLLQKWTTMKGNTYNECQWKRVFAPETAPEQSIKKHVLRAY